MKVIMQILLKQTKIVHFKSFRILQGFWGSLTAKKNSVR